LCDAKQQFYGDPRQDLQLSHTLRLLEQVHAMYFKDEEEGGAEASPPAPGQAKNVADCLAAIRREVLVGTSLVFSGILPRGVDPRNSDLGHIAQALGAEVTLNVNESTTHVVAENPNTEKVFMARRRPEVHVVKRLWLQLTFLHCERKGEEEFKLPPSAKRASGDGQGQGAADGKRHKVQQEQGNGGEAQPANGQAANGKDAGEVKMAAMEVDRRGEGGKRRGDDDDDDDDEEEEEEEQANGEEEDDEGQGDGEGWDGEEGDGNSRSDAGTQEEEDLMKELEAELMQDL
jgi:RNA polymerase II subunit A-like phosphatase